MRRVWLALLLAVWGCSNEFAAPSLVDTLRVLAVRPEPASGAPGQTSTLELVLADGASGASASDPPRPLSVIWLGGCDNPPSRQFFGCFPWLGSIAARLSSRVLDTPSGSLPASAFAIGTRFDLQVPDDILSGAPMAPTDPVHFGVSYAFFAACAGELRARPDLTDRVPVECVSLEGGQTLGRRDFVTGYATLYSYAGVTNHNPILSSVSFGQTVLNTTACSEDADCRALPEPADPGFTFVCGSHGSCALSVPACTGTEACPAILVNPAVDPASAEVLPRENAREIVWANFYSTAGSFDTATQLINDRSTGFIADHGSYFHSPAWGTGPTTVWVTVNDERAGSAFQSFEVWTH